ncbi:MAG: CehA/McbA family metallohydrolase [Opitutae bacterium]|nr:CehA/McbA family metallohydrolase [Opitutae bacterium]
MNRLILLSVFLGSAVLSQAAWFKGNTHTHTINSDGNATPDVVARWYRENGYQFVVITDHEYVTDVAPLNALFGREGQFLVLSGQEVSQHLGQSRDPRDPTNRPSCHVNAINSRRVVVPIGGTAGKAFGFAPPGMTMAETYARNIAEIRAAGGLAQVNHPNWQWSVRLEDLLGLPDDTLFEIWNGHPAINNLGGTDDDGNVAPSSEALWDSLLSKGKRLWGVAADDSHYFYHLDEIKGPKPGQAWVVVRADALTAEKIAAALARGEFYSSTGVVIDDLAATADEVTLRINGQPRGPRYLTKFVGQGGRVLAEVAGLRPHYEFKGDEGYVRAHLTDSNGHQAWTQPVFVRRR